MKSAFRLAMATTAALMLAGCASGGGSSSPGGGPGGGGFQPTSSDEGSGRTVCYFFIFCGEPLPEPQPFTSWSEARTQWSAARSGEYYAGFILDAVRVGSTPTNLDYTFAYADAPAVPILFIGDAILANPGVLGWEAQSFGVWTWERMPTGAASFGGSTPASAIPRTGAASFSGLLAGAYVSPGGGKEVATADLTVTANFSTRQLDFLSANTVVGAQLAPDLDLSGSLGYAQGGGIFTGTLTNASGTMSGPARGQYYGAGAGELGGVFALNAPAGDESFIGGFGAADRIAIAPSSTLFGDGEFTPELEHATDGTLLRLAHPDPVLDFSAPDAVILRAASMAPPIDVAYSASRPGASSPFVALAADRLAVVANPRLSGWSYQSFGVWHDPTAGILPLSFGSATPGRSVPLGGQAGFTGSLAGLYVSPTGEGSIAAANLHVSVDFFKREVVLSSRDTRLTRELSTGSAAPNLDVTGRFHYAPGSASFQGDIWNNARTMGGASQGRFYGPQANELGGTFSMKSEKGTNESFTGAYGARR